MKTNRKTKIEASPESRIIYNEFIGSVAFNANDKVFHGKIEFIDDLVTFEGTTVDELMNAFIEAVNDYVELCRSVGKEPLKSFKGSFNVRINPELHRKAAMVSQSKGLSLNQFVAEALEKCVSEY